jgi:uncharacterized membrane protein
MAFCKACGTELGGAAFCPKCGASQSASGTPAGVPAGTVAVSSASATEGIQENVAGLLCYIFGWLSGLIFLLIDKRSFVRFHGAQAIAFNIAVIVVWIAFWIVVLILGFITAMMHMPIGFLTIFLWPVIGIAIFASWIYVMYKAYQHEKYKLPIIGNIVERMVN